MVKVFLVGAGPGDPELLTMKALRLLGAADVVLHDSLIGEAILKLAKSDAKVIDVGKRCGRHTKSQAEISALLVQEALAGHNVVRLKGGDPMVFGRATEEMEALSRHGIAFGIVPGVTAASGAAASIGASLTRRGIASSLHFLAGHGAQNGLPAHDWASIVRTGGTLAIYMGGQTMENLGKCLVQAGLREETPAFAIENISLPDERVFRATVSSISAVLGTASPAGPLLVLIGDALAF